jgi:hypothetical protein
MTSRLPSRGCRPHGPRPSRPLSLRERDGGREERTGPDPSFRPASVPLQGREGRTVLCALAGWPMSVGREPGDRAWEAIERTARGSMTEAWALVTSSALGAVLRVAAGLGRSALAWARVLSLVRAAPLVHRRRGPGASLGARRGVRGSHFFCSAGRDAVLLPRIISGIYLITGTSRIHSDLARSASDLGPRLPPLAPRRHVP